tara:strand:- start:11 stop:442 length:432 start_codon:yes stop_codon:yes gene_type:complete
MAYWLFKSEPSTWSWQDQVKKGEEGEGWDGVRNYQANNNMKIMQTGDYGFFYHSVKEKQIVGTVTVIGEHRPDPTDKSGRFGMVVIKAIEEVSNFVTLKDMKSNDKLSDLALIKQSRLSVVPVSKEHWEIICNMANISIDKYK